MIYPDKTITSNPFVDNAIYYSKLMALNCTVKDLEEALSYESVDSLRAGELLIASVEKTSTYELYPSIPKEILEKYIALMSNLDLYASSNLALKTHMNSFGLYERTSIMEDISALARQVYADHYEIMLKYLDEVGETWFDDNKDLYDKCMDLSATYEDLFDALPEYTKYRIIKTYLNNYDDTDIHTLSGDLNAFKDYINNRTDETIHDEVFRINEAMRNVFVSHYDIMVFRGYVRESDAKWQTYEDDIDVYAKCLNGNGSYLQLYDLFPQDELLDSLVTCFGQANVDAYGLMNGVDILEQFLKTISIDRVADTKAINDNMSAKYVDNYNSYMNSQIYDLCMSDSIDYYELSEYLPYETRRMIINSKIDEVTNLQVYSESKAMLDSYLDTLTREERNRIKLAITKDMQEWYPLHHVETNNYYRAFLGQPPMDENGNVVEDTLVHTYDINTGEFKEFGKQFTNRAPTGIYPEIHWKQNLCDFDSYDTGILNQYGIIDDWIAAAKANINDIRYRYLKYLGDDKLDIYTCRKAMDFQLIGVPTIDDSDFKRKFMDIYSVNRDYVIRTVYSDAHKFQSDYYNKFIIIFILMNTIMDVCTSIPEFIINRDVFDSRCIKYLFESFGIPYYSEIPIKYQRAMLKNLNILIKFKSSTKNMIDICSLFGFNDVRVFGYYLFKQRNIDIHTGEYLFEENNDVTYDLNEFYVMDENGELQDYNGVRFSKLLDYRHYDEDKYTKLITIEDENGNSISKRIIREDVDVYIKDKAANDYIHIKDVDYFHKIKANTEAAELKFIKVPIDDELTKYKNDPDYTIPYDEIVYQDEGDTWDGGEDHDKLYRDLLDYEFNAVKTKYISVETVTELTELSFQVSYFYNMLFDNIYNEDALTVEIPHIKIGRKFRFMDIVCYLFALMYLYNDLEDNIMYSPTQILYVKGYNFNSDLNEVLQDSNAFQQNHPISAEPLKDYQKYNIFDINKRIEEDGYDYREAFNDIWIKSFNLECDVDALDAWLYETCQMHLDDFIVDDSLTTFNQVITLRNFFSLNNSYYQKNIFNGTNLYPVAYNQNIKYGYNYTLYNKTLVNDINKNWHEYVTEDGYYMEVIDDISETLFIRDYNEYILIGTESYAIYYKYKKDDGNFIRIDNSVYTKGLFSDDIFVKLFDGEIGILDSDGRYIFAANKYYIKNENGSYTEVTEDRFFRDDPNDPSKKVLNFGQYFIFKDGKWILDPNNCYIKIEKNGTISYILVSDSDKYQNVVIPEEDRYVLHSDGHFIKLTDTDFYRDPDRDHNYEYTEEDCYVIVDFETEYYDATANPIVYYQKLTDYYDENNYTYYDGYYVKDSEGNYIPYSKLLDPNNCYFSNESGMLLVVDYLGKFVDYTNPDNVKYVLILQPNNDYLKYSLDENDYRIIEDPIRRYVINSDSAYVTVLYNNFDYGTTKSLIVIFNKYLDSYDDGLEKPERYDPEKTDGIWDENDWYYTDGYEGEHKWYYRKPGEEYDPEDNIKDPVGSGFFLESKSYIGDIELEEGSKYYFALDIETNFNGTIQIVCDADNSITGATSRIYEMSRGEQQHISQMFTANAISRPSLKFLIYDYPENPINIGDFIIISNIRFVKAYNNRYIAQDVPSYDRLQELYRTNEAIYKYLTNLMISTDNFHLYQIYKKIYDSYMTASYNKEAFKIGENKYAKTYTDFLETRDAVLYEKLCYFKSLDPDAMHKEIADNIIEVTYAIDDCIDTYSYGYLYSYFPAVSASYIQQYIIKIINFFKSWKVQLLGINTVYKLNDLWQNTVRVLECQQLRNRYDFIKHNVFVHGTVKINPIDDVNVSGKRYDELYPDLVKYSHHYKDRYLIKHRVRIIDTTADKTELTYDSDDQLEIIFNNETNVVDTTDGILTITSSDSTFRVEDGNLIVMTTEEDEQDIFPIQKIGEINKDSTDIIEWRKVFYE